jgi:multisubunit Na+/H+ antiporter MnhB subunit
MRRLNTTFFSQMLVLWSPALFGVIVGAVSVASFDLVFDRNQLIGIAAVCATLLGASVIEVGLVAAATVWTVSPDDEPTEGTIDLSGFPIPPDWEPPSDFPAELEWSRFEAERYDEFMARYRGWFQREFEAGRLRYQMSSRSWVLGEPPRSGPAESASCARRTAGLGVVASSLLTLATILVSSVLEPGVAVSAVCVCGLSSTLLMLLALPGSLALARRSNAPYVFDKYASRGK